jgi:hypothetical protein
MDERKGGNDSDEEGRGHHKTDKRDDERDQMDQIRRTWEA